jgi:hypothetical protein
MKIIDRLPLADWRHLVTVRAEAVGVYRNQIRGRGCTHVCSAQDLRDLLCQAK